VEMAQQKTFTSESQYH